MTTSPYQIQRDGHGVIQAGDKFTISRVFKAEDVVLFSTLTGDDGEHHQTHQGKPVVHGLLTGSLPTILGGALDFLIGTLTYHFHAPVYIEEKITCSLIIESAEPHKRGLKLNARIECINGEGLEVLTGTCAGVAKTVAPEFY